MSWFGLIGMRRMPPPTQRFVGSVHHPGEVAGPARARRRKRGERLAMHLRRAPAPLSIALRVGAYTSIYAIGPSMILWLLNPTPPHIAAAAACCLGLGFLVGAGVWLAERDRRTIRH
ncbi:MAG: hypothetical protein AB7K09_20640 [Planctomycetota bacterium]